MGVVEIVIIILIVLGLIGLISYFVYVYIQDKNEIDSHLSNTYLQLQEEETNRVSNIKYVVDQVNTVNSDIAKQFATSNSMFQSSINSKQAQITANLGQQQVQYTNLSNVTTGLNTSTNRNTSNIDSIVTGFGKYMNFGNPFGNNSYNLLNLPSSPPANLNLMAQVNLLMGLTAQNLSPVGGSNINFCYGPGNKNCSSFPNSDGDTVISAAPKNTSGFTKDRTNEIVLQGDTKVNGTLNANTIKLCNNKTPQVCKTLTVNDSGNLVVDNIAFSMVPASAPVASAPVVSAPVVSAPVASAPVASAPVASAPVASAPGGA